MHERLVMPTLVNLDGKRQTIIVWLALFDGFVTSHFQMLLPMFSFTKSANS
jgi:hypothetical protein